MKNLIFKIVFTACLLGLALLYSCSEEIQEFSLIETIPCENTNVVADPTIISDFECQNNYELPDVEQILNPSRSGLNTSSFVGKYTDPTGPWDALIIDFGQDIDLSIYNTFSIKVQTNVAGPLIAKLEGGSSVPVERMLDIRAGDWMEYTFDFSDQLSQSHQKLVLFFNAANETNGSDVYHIDDLKFLETSDPCLGITPDITVAINDFDCHQALEIPEVVVVPTPNKSDVNNSKFAGQYVDEPGPWDAIIIENPNAFDLSTQNVFSIKVLAPVAGILKVKLEGGTAAPVEKDAQISTLNQWVEYTYDFSEQANTDHTKLVLFVNAGVEAGENDIYYIDELKFVELSDPCLGVVQDNSIINDFDCQQNTSIPGFINVEIVENPRIGENNSSTQVLRVTDDGTAPWDALVLERAEAFDLSTNNQFRIKVLSDRSAPMLAKLEGGSSAPKEVWGDLLQGDNWMEYQFDFSDQAEANHTKLVLFFNGGQDNGTPTDIYHIDDLIWAPYDPCFGTMEVEGIVNDFECQMNYAVTCCISTMIIDNPNPTADNESERVLEVTDDGTAPWDALVFENSSDIDLANRNQLKIKIWSTQAVPLLAKLEGGASTPVEVWGQIDEVDAWKTYTFDFSAQASESHRKIVFFFNGGQENGSPMDIYYIDDLLWE